jgi:hypothetical protein
MTAVPETLFDRVVLALHAVGLDPKVDADLENVTFEDDGRPTVGVVMTHFDAVVFYSVWPEQVPDDRLVATAEFVTRANTDLYTSAFELDLDKQIISVRSAVAGGPLDGLADVTVGHILQRALDDARQTAARHHSALAAVMLGRDVMTALSLRQS